MILETMYSSNTKRKSQKRGRRISDRYVQVRVSQEIKL